MIEDDAGGNSMANNPKPSTQQPAAQPAQPEQSDTKPMQSEQSDTRPMQADPGLDNQVNKGLGGGSESMPSKLG